MKRTVVITCLALIAGTSFAQQKNFPATLTALTDSIRAIVQRHSIPGLMVGITTRDSVLFSGGFGYADVEAKRPVTGQTLFRMGSVTKMFVSLSSENGQMDYTFLDGLDFQDDYLLAETAWGLVMIREKEGILYLVFPVGNMHVKRHSPVATGYYVEFILLSGDPSKENALRIDSTESRLYTFEEEGNVDCHLSMQLPEKEPWMALLKVSCMFEKEVANTPKYYGLKVVTVGRGVNS